MPYSPEGNWQAGDLFDVLRRLLDDSALSDREKVMAHALIDAHHSQYLADRDHYYRQFAVHGGLLGLPPGSPQLSAALAAQEPPQ